MPPDQMSQTFSPSATIELPDIGNIAQESSALRQFLGAASRISENVEPAVLIRHIDQAIVEYWEWPHPYIGTIAEILNDVCLRPGHEHADLQWQGRVGDIPSAETG